MKGVGVWISLSCGVASCELHSQIIKLPLGGTRLLPHHPHGRRRRVSISNGGTQCGGEIFYAAHALPRIRGPFNDEGYLPLQTCSTIAAASLSCWFCTLFSNLH